MINISELSLNFSGEPLFKDVNLKFTQGNCYGVIGANGAGKSTFLRILSGDLDPSTGTVSIAPKTRMSVLKQDHFAFNDETVLNTVLGGNERLLAVMREKDALYMKDPFTEEDGNKAAELEAEFAEMGGWDAETETSQLLNGLGLDADAILYTEMKNLGDVEKVKVLLARALFGKPDILLLDEPFSALDEHIKWKIELELADTLRSFPGGVLFVSHSRDEIYRLCDTVCVLNEGKSDPKTTVAELFRAPLTVGAARISGCKNISRAEAGAGGTLYCADWAVSLKTALPLRENTAYAGIRAHYFTLSGTENPITCTVERVIPNPFSVVYMMKTPGGALLRMESEKAEALHTGDTITLHIAPEDVMPLTE